MFGTLRSGYFLLLTSVATIWLAAVAVTDYPLGTYLGTIGRGRFMILWFLPPVLWICWLGILVMVRGFERPLRTITRMAWRNRYRFIRGTLFGLLLIPLSIAFSAFKRSIPDIVPFYADPLFADLDNLFFLGHDPWHLSHGLLGTVGSLVLDRVYMLWFPASALLLAIFLYTKDQRFQLRGLLTYVATWFLLGSIAATLLASVGPVYYSEFYGNDRFAALSEALAVDDAKVGLFAPGIQSGLLRGFGGTFIGSGISAMPSLHVAMAFLLYLAVPRRFRWLALIYLSLIWLGSVHLGWHYAVDGLLSIAIVAPLWHYFGKYVSSLEGGGDEQGYSTRNDNFGQGGAAAL